MNLNNVVYEMSAGTFSQLPKCTQPEIVFSGRSNVGKSSLINKILQRKNLARVSSQPGKTITINFYKADTARLVDLPGYGYAKHSFQERNRWGQMIEKYLNSGRDIRLIVQLIDMRHKPTADDLQMLDFLQQTGVNFVVALTKADKLNKKEYTECLEMHKEIITPFGPFDIIPFSAVKGDGADDLKRCIICAADGVLEAEKSEGKKSPKKVVVKVKKSGK